MGHFGGNLLNKQSVGKFVSFKGSLAWKGLDSAFLCRCKSKVTKRLVKLESEEKYEHCGLYLQVESTNSEV